jgi:hypothetical protein
MVYHFVFKKFFKVKPRKKKQNWRDVLPINHPYPVEGDFAGGFPDIRDYDLTDPYWYHKYADAIKKYEMKKNNLEYDDDSFLDDDLPF